MQAVDARNDDYSKFTLQVQMLTEKLEDAKSEAEIEKVKEKLLILSPGSTCK